MGSMFSFGFGFVEVGTVTPMPQKETKPRVFRLKEDEAIINSLGFNNIGSQKKLKKIFLIFVMLKSILKIIGINIGKNKFSLNAIDDYHLFNSRFS